MTSKIFVPRHEYPARHVAISASQNVYSDRQRVEEKDAKSLKHYLKRGLMPSLKFYRTADQLERGYDENKAMFPVYGKVPLFALTTIAALESGMQVSLVGSREVGDIAEELRKYYLSIQKPEFAESLAWTPEWGEGEKDEIAENRKKLTISNSMERLGKSLGLSERYAFIFTAGDVMFYDYPRVACDPDLVDHSLVLDLNGRETINPPFPRNYYHVIRTVDGRKVHFKEPNVWTIGAEFNLGMSDESYKNAQKGGFGVKAFLTMAGRNMARHLNQLRPRDAAFVFSSGIMEGLHFASGRRFIPEYAQRSIESVAKFLDMSPVRIKAEHDDWTRLKDVDAMHDYVFVRRLVKEHLWKIFPGHIAHSINEFAGYLDESGVAGKIPTISELPDMLNEKTERMQHALKKRRVDFKLEKPFDNHGNLVEEPREGESLELAVEHSRRYLEGYHERISRPDVKAPSKGRRAEVFRRFKSN